MIITDKNSQLIKSRNFPRIGILSKPTGDNITETLKQVCLFLQERNHQLVLDTISSQRLANSKFEFQIATEQNIGALCDLLIVIGGDGSLLKAARAIVNHQIPILGINGGNLGFLADVRPQDLEYTLGPILNGDYYSEQRTMLYATIVKDKVASPGYLALNDIVLHHGDIARLIEFQIFINDRFVIDQRADGVITSTPTGSTAYALSGGGPIVYPTLDVLTLMPMFPHALNSRPIVVDKNSKIKLVLAATNRMDAKFSCDGQTHISLAAGDEIHIQANKHNLLLLHPKDYDYFSVLRNKLGWNLKPQE